MDMRTHVLASQDDYINAVGVTFFLDEPLKSYQELFIHIEGAFRPLSSKNQSAVCLNQKQNLLDGDTIAIDLGSICFGLHGI